MRDEKPIGSYPKASTSAYKRAGATGKIPHDFRWNACTKPLNALLPHSAAMAMVGYWIESIYRRYAIADEAMPKESALKLAVFHASEKGTEFGDSHRNERKHICVRTERCVGPWFPEGRSVVKEANPEHANRSSLATSSSPACRAKAWTKSGYSV